MWFYSFKNLFLRIFRKEEKSSKPPAAAAAISARQIPCQPGPFEVCKIKPSAMFFTQDVLREEGSVIKRCKASQMYYRVCYSSHSSMDELCEFVRYFRPKRVVPCVVPKEMSMVQVRIQGVRKVGLHFHAVAGLMGFDECRKTAKTTTVSFENSDFPPFSSFPELESNKPTLRTPCM